jgi:hypothetical protein
LTFRVRILSNAAVGKIVERCSPGGSGVVDQDVELVGVCADGIDQFGAGPRG